MKKSYHAFGRCWPELESKLEIIAQHQSEVTQTVRSDSEKLDEILELVRSLAQPKLGYSLSPSYQELLKKIRGRKDPDIRDIISFLVSLNYLKLDKEEKEKDEE